MAAIYDFEVETITGEHQTLTGYRGQVMLIVNTASRCGFTPQYEGLQRLHESFGPRGLALLAFPCNQFGRQEPGSAEDIVEFCSSEYNVSFPLHAKIDVNGGRAHPLFQYLKDARPGLLGSRAIKWNFTKFLVDKQGRVIQRFAPSFTPRQLARHIERLLD